MGYLYTKPVKGQSGVYTSPVFMQPSVGAPYAFSYEDYPLDVIAKSRDKLIYKEQPLTYKSRIIDSDVPDTTPTTKYTSQLPYEFQTTPKRFDWGKVSQGLGAAANVGIDVSNILTNKALIEKAAKQTKDALSLGLTRRTKEVTPILREVAGVEDIPAEVLAERKKAISNIRSQYKGADATMRAISAAMAEGEKAKLTESMGAERAAHLVGERKRVAAQTGENQAQQAIAMNKRADFAAAEDARIQDLRMKIASVDPQETEAKRALYTKGLNKLKNMVDAGIAYGLKKEGIERHELLDSIDAELNTIMSMDEMGRQQNAGRYSELISMKNNLLAEGLPSYAKVLSGQVGKAKNGVKLAPKS